MRIPLKKNTLFVRKVDDEVVDKLKTDKYEIFGCNRSYFYTRKNAQVVTGLQTSCDKSVHKLSTRCVRTACSQLL